MFVVVGVMSTDALVPLTTDAFWIGVSPDHAKAISGQYNFSIIDFATEQVTGQSSGNSQSFGAVSPVGSRAVGFDPMRHEGLYFYDYTNPTPVYRGTTNSGQPPEGDAPHRVRISPDGLTAISTNVLSDNLTIINTVDATVETILPLGARPQDIVGRSLIDLVKQHNPAIVDYNLILEGSVIRFPELPKEK